MKPLLGMYVDGESKTGKGAACTAIVAALREHGLHVYHDVAGDFFRRFAALVRQKLELSDADALPVGPALAEAAAVVYAAGQAFDADTSLGDLQRPAIGSSVSTVGELAITQRAGNEWYARAAARAQAESADVLALDGRNPRLRIDEQLAGRADVQVQTIFDLYILCDLHEAARRTLLGNGVAQPTEEQLAAMFETLRMRRTRDRQREDNPFIVPVASVAFVPGKTDPKAVVAQSWRTAHNAPLTITLDNTHLAKDSMLTAVAGLGLAAIDGAPAAQ